MAEKQRYYWIKLKTDCMADDTPLDALLGMPNGSEYVCLYIKLCLMTANKNGRLCNQFGEVLIPYDAEKIAKDMKHFSIDTVRVAMELYKKMGLIYTMEDGVLAISGADEMVGSETSWAKYKREERIGQTAGHPLDNVQQRLDIRDKSKDIREESIDIKSKEERKRTTLASKTFFPNDELLEAKFHEFIEHRKKLKKPLDEYKAEGIIKELEKLSGGDNDKAINILQQSIDQRWQGVFELKNKPASSWEDTWRNA